MLKIGDKIEDCWMMGYGKPLDNMGDEGQIEFIGRDYIIVRNLEKDIPIFVELTIRELEEILND